MMDPWTAAALVEGAAIVTYVAAPVISSSRDALVAMGDAVQTDVEDDAR